jgi:RES domain-containing protein
MSPNFVTVWRLVDRRWEKSAFNGEGARLYGGRWNSPGTAIVYTAQNQSLAILETLVHLDSPALLSEFVLIGVEFDIALVTLLDRASLPANWKDDPVAEEVQAIGDRWAANQTSPVLAVPSVLVPNEFNYLLNPNHPDFSKLKIAQPIAFEFNARFSR